MAHSTSKQHVISSLGNMTTSGPAPVHAVSPKPSGQHFPNEATQEHLRQLKKQGFTTGLAKSLVANSNVFPVRFWVVDNSSSMSTLDGHRMIESSDHNKIKFKNCSRWEEIRECVIYHAQMAALLEAPTNFRLLNVPGGTPARQEFSIAQTGNTASSDVETARSMMNSTQPCGATPLTQHIYQIREGVRALAPSLERDGQKAVIVLATDGLPTNEHGRSNDDSKNQFLQALRSLEGLPVWIVIRLCTDDDQIVGYYNELDEQLELSLEVLDDFVAEAKEVYEHNSWLNYALPLHRIREFGFHDRVFDLIDERRLTKDEVRQLCVLLFGEDNFDATPDPSVDWIGFLNEIERVVNKEGMIWNPIARRVMPWIDTKKLNRIYGTASCAPGCVIL